MSVHDDEMIDRATKALGNALARGADIRSAMRSALAAAASTGCRHEHEVVIDQVGLMVGFGDDVEDGWVIQVEPGTDLAPLLAQGPLFSRIDRALEASISRGAARAAREETERRHDERRHDDGMGGLRSAA